MNRHCLTRSLVYVLLLLVVGCTSRAWYEGMQTGAAVDCSQAPNDDERQRCRERANSLNYDNYQRERQSLPPPRLKAAPPESSAGQP